MKYATERLINSVWTIKYEILDNGKAFVHSISRDNPIGYKKEKELNRFSLNESNDRTVNGFYLSEYEPFKYKASDDGDYIEVENKQHIFSYGS